MSDKDNNQNRSDNDKQVNPMKAIKTTPLPTKHEFVLDESHKNRKKSR